ncbi:MAG: GNAT family N-acetyltransferase [Gemmatimonadaceae bacterium]
MDIAEDQVAGRWDALVRASPQSNPYSTSAWVHGVEEATGIRSHLWVAIKGEDWLGGVVVPYRRRFGRDAGVMTPITAYTCPVFAATLFKASLPNRAVANVIEVAKPLATIVAQNYSSVRHVTLPGLCDVRPWQWAGWRAEPSYTFCVDLSQELAISHSVRKHVNKCERSGAQVSETWDMDAFWAMQESTIGRQGVRLGVSRREAIVLATRLYGAGLAFMVTANDAEGKPLASRILLGVRGTSTLFDWLAGSDAERLSLGASPWLMTRVAALAARRGYRYWDLCGAQIESIARFKSEIGGELTHGFRLNAPATAVERIYALTRQAGSAARRQWRELKGKAL